MDGTKKVPGIMVGYWKMSFRRTKGSLTECTCSKMYTIRKTARSAARSAARKPPFRRWTGDWMTW